MSETQQSEQLRGVNVYNWTQQVWDKEAANPNIVGAKKWRDLDMGFQRYLLDKTKDEVEKALEG